MPGQDLARPLDLDARAGWGPRQHLGLIGREWREHPLRLAVALLAIALGVALALAVQLINASALAEFGAAVRAVNGQPDLELRPREGETLAEALYARVAALPQVALASPVVELETVALDAQGRKVNLRVLGLDALQAAQLSPALLPRPDDQAADRFAIFDPEVVYLNAAALALVERRPAPADGSPAPRPVLRVQSGPRLLALPVAGRIGAEGPPLAVIDIAGAQALFGRLGRLSRIDLKLAPGADGDAAGRSAADALAAALAQAEANPPPPVLAAPQPQPAPALEATAGTWRLTPPGESAQRLSNLSRAYRVNLTVLALVALFTGAFLVFSVQALAVAKRVPQLALLGVLGLDAQRRLHLVLIESALIGTLGAALGVALGTALAWAALRVLGGDLGNGALTGGAPPLQWSAGAAVVYGALGVIAALAGGWLPAQQAQALAPAQSLKGLGDDAPRVTSSGLRARIGAAAGPLLLALSVGLALLPALDLALIGRPDLGTLPLAAYIAIACGLLGGIVSVPTLVAAVLRHVRAPMAPIALLAVERARDQRHAATIAVAGVVASLALSVALTVMVASFRDSVSAWLGQVLPADLYARTATSTAQAHSAWLDAAVVDAAARLPGVQRVQAQRLVPLALDPALPPVVLIAREIGPDAARALPLVGALTDPIDAADRALPAVYATENFIALHGARIEGSASGGGRLTLPLPDGRRATVWVRGVWRDYARQQGALAIERADWQALTGDARVNDLAFWLAPGAEPGPVQDALRALVTQAGSDAALLEFATPASIRAISLAIFDRSFAVTYWLQAVAIGIGLAGIAASFSAQVLARRREFGALLHLGFSRRQVLTLVCAEGALWTGVGTALGLALGLGVSAVLVHVVNPQSFHWTMDLSLPLGRLAALAAAVMAAGVATAWLAGRAAAGRDMVLAVREDW